MAAGRGQSHGGRGQGGKAATTADGERPSGASETRWRRDFLSLLGAPEWNWFGLAWAEWWCWSRRRGRRCRRLGVELGEEPEAESRNSAPRCGDSESDACQTQPETAAGSRKCGLEQVLVWVQVLVLILVLKKGKQSNDSTFSIRRTETDNRWVKRRCCWKRWRASTLPECPQEEEVEEEEVVVEEEAGPPPWGRDVSEGGAGVEWP